MSSASPTPLVRLGALAAAATLALLLVAGASAQAAPGEISGELPPDGGVALVTWGGGSVEELDARAAAGDCDLHSVWTFIEGEALGYIVGAPAFVNETFTAEFPGAQLPEMQLLLRCATAAPGTSIGEVSFEAAFGGAQFERPVELVAYPGGRFLLAEQGGRILMLSGADTDQHSMFLDLGAATRPGGEEGLLSVALDPAFEENRHAWVYYTPSGGEERRTRVSRFAVSADDIANPASELVVIEIPQPFANHNGGALRFGPDGMLYLGLGDGGSGGDPQGHGQNPETLLGSIIRIDVSAASASAPYAIPSDNPFVDAAARDETWAYGLRNPWRMSFDPDTGALWAADVGQSAVEEVNIIEGGNNYGWNVLEGDQCFQAADCDRTGMTAPVATYTHALGCSVTGGVVSRADAAPEIANAYVYSDYCSGRVWALDADDPGEVTEIGRVSGNPVSFATGHDGHVYIVRFGEPILRIVSP